MIWIYIDVGKVIFEIEIGIFFEHLFCDAWMKPKLVGHADF